MTRHWKKASVGTSLALAALALAGYAYTRTQAAPTYHLANGIEITPLEIPRDDVAEVLDVRVWKFDAVMPDDRPVCWFLLKQYHHGKFVRELGGGGLPPTSKGDRHYHVTLSMAPLGGDFNRASQVREIWKTSSGAEESDYFTNPLRESGGQADGIGVSEADNRVYLMGGGKQASWPAGQNDIDIGVDFEPGKLNR